jgi:hypothetical protein
VSRERRNRNHSGGRDVGRRSEILHTLACGAVAAAVVSWCAIQCRAECCCGGPNTLFNWNGCQSSGGSGGDDSGKDAGDDSPFSQPLSADRPGFGDSPTTVGCGVYQLELGYQYTFGHEHNTSTIDHSYPQALLRVGMLANWFEARVSWSMEQETDKGGLLISPPPTGENPRPLGGPVGGQFTPSRTFVGSDDMNVGFKIALTDQDGCRPQMGIVADMYVPTGSAAFTAGEVLPEIEWIYQWSLTKKLSITGNNFFSRELDGETNQPYLEFAQALTGNYQFTDPLGGYVEWNISTPDGADTDPTLQVFQGGFTLLCGKNLQLDAEAGVGLNRATPDYFVGCGVSTRW